MEIYSTRATNKWLNRDPLSDLAQHVEAGEVVNGTKKLLLAERSSDGANLFTFCRNSPGFYFDAFGLHILLPWPFPIPVPTSKHEVSEDMKKVGLGGKCCNNSLQTEWWNDNGEWKPLAKGECTGFFDDCDGYTCSGAFYRISTGSSGSCSECGGSDSNKFWPGGLGEKPPGGSEPPKNYVWRM